MRAIAVRSRAMQRALPLACASWCCRRHLQPRCGCRERGLAPSAGCPQHRCGVWRSLVVTPPAVLHMVCVVWDVGAAGMRLRCVQPELKAVLQPYGADRVSAFDARAAALSLARLVGLVQRSRTGCCSLRPRGTGSKCRRATCRASPLLPFVSLPSAHSNQRRCAVLEHGSTSAYQIAGALRVRLDLVGHAAVGLGRSRRVREGRRGAGAAAVECSS
jgi:hypothetical protein